MIYHNLTSKGGGMPMRTGIPLSAKVFWHDTIMND